LIGGRGETGRRKGLKNPFVRPASNFSFWRAFHLENMDLYPGGSRKEVEGIEARSRTGAKCWNWPKIRYRATKRVMAFIWQCGRGEIGRRNRLPIGVPTGKFVEQNRSKSGNANGLESQANPEPSPRLREGVETGRAAPSAERPWRRDSPGHERRLAAAKAEVVRKSVSL
jgi:hypothetical protein